MRKKLLLCVFSLFLCIIQALDQTQLPLGLQLPNDPFWSENTQKNHNNSDHFKEPSDNVNYADYHYIGAHNAHVYPPFFQIIHQQDQSTIEMLSYGVRGLMWDTYNCKNAKVCLSHGTPGIISFLQKGNNVYQSLQYELRHLIEFMKRSPKAIITIILEDYADLQQTVQEINTVTKDSQYDPVLKPIDWIVESSSGEHTWPTLGWMRHHNKRLIIFTQHGENTSHTWQQFKYCSENQHGTTDESKLCSQRIESQKVDNTKRRLIIFNNFSHLAVIPTIKDTKNQLSYDTVKRITTNCQQKNFANKRLVNGYFANRIIDSCNDLYKNKQKTAFEYVNELNNKADNNTP